MKDKKGATWKKDSTCVLIVYGKMDKGTREWLGASRPYKEEITEKRGQIKGKT